MADDARPSTALDRPALASVLATVTCRSSDLDTTNITPYEGVMCSRCGGSGASDERCGRCGSTGCYPCEAGCNSGWWPWAIETPAEALEAMVTRGVLPPSFAGDASRAFWCDRCNGKGNGEWRNDVAIRCAAGANKRGCEGRHWPHPRTLLDLLAWASLGGDAITRAEQLAREAATRLRPWGVRPPVETATTPDGREVECEKPWRVVWRVGKAGHASRGATEVEIARMPECNVYRTGEIWKRDTPIPGIRRDIYFDGEFCDPIRVLWDEGVAALDAIDGDALVLVCPPLGGSNE